MPNASKSEMTERAHDEGEQILPAFIIAGRKADRTIGTVVQQAWPRLPLHASPTGTLPRFRQ